MARIRYFVAMVWLLVLIVCGAAVVLGPVWKEVAEHATLADVLEQISAGQEYLGRVASVMTAADERSLGHTASLHQPVASFYSFGDRFVKYILNAPDVGPAEGPRRNTFTVLMASGAPTHLPNKYQPVRNNKQLLFNDVVIMLAEKEVGFRGDEVEGIGISFTNCLVDTLWYLEGQYQKFESRKEHGKVLPIPKLFSRFNKGGINNEDGYNDWIAKRRKAPQMSQQGLRDHSNKLISVISHSRFSTRQWKTIREGVEGLVKSLRTYAEEMEQSLKRVVENQQSSESVRNPELDTASRDIPGNGQEVKPIHAKLVSALDSLPCYDPLLVDESMSSTDKFVRYRFFQNLQLPFSTHLFQYHAGSQIGNISFIWKIPENEKDRSERGQKLALAKAKSLLPSYSTRAMRKAFTDRYAHVTELSPVVLRSMYRFLTNDASQETQGSDIDNRLEMILDDPDVDIIVDKREVNAGRPEQLTAFWTELDKVLEEYGKAVDDRRHSPDVAHMPIAISVPDLIQQVSKRLPPGTAIPSESWVRYQFWPRNRFSETAKKYTCRFDLTYKIQRRQLRKAHIDGRYCAVLFKYLKEMAVMFREQCLLIFLVDKSKIPIGK